MNKLKEIVKNNTVHINKYRAGFLYYTVTVEEDTYIFPVPTSEAGEATFKKSDKALDKLKDTVKRVPKMGGGMMGRQMYKKGSKKAVGKSSLGMQSVIHGLDSNPKITAADPKAKFIAKNKKT